MPGLADLVVGVPVCRTYASDESVSSLGRERLAAAVPADQPAETRALLEYHFGHAALLRGDIDEARACWHRAVALSMEPIECKCAKAELEQLDR